MAPWKEQGWLTAVVIARCFCREVRERGMGTWCFRHHSLSDVPFKTGGKQMVMRRGPRLKGFHGINGIEEETSNLLHRPRLNSSSFPVQRKQAEGSSRLSPFWRNSYFQSFWTTLHCALEKEHVSNGLQAAKSVGFTAHIAELTPVTARRQVCSPCLSPLLDLKGLRLEIASLCYWDSMKDDCHCHGQLWQRQFDVLPSRAF